MKKEEREKRDERRGSSKNKEGSRRHELIEYGRDKGREKEKKSEGIKEKSRTEGIRNLEGKKDTEKDNRTKTEERRSDGRK